MSCICCVYVIHILTKIFWYTNYNIWICHIYGVYILYIYWQNYFDILTIIFWYAMHMLRLYNTYTDNLFCQGHDSAAGLDIVLLKQQHFSVSGQAAYPARQHPLVEYVYRCSHPMLQFLVHRRAWQRLWSCGITFRSGQYVVCVSPAFLSLYAASHRYCCWPLQLFRRGHSAWPGFLQPFEELRLRTAGIMESKGIHRVSEPSPVPMLYVGRVEDLLGRVPLIPCFLDGNATFRISTAADSGTFLSAAVPMVLALPRGGAAMFTRSTPGCGILDGPSLAWAASQWPRLRRSEGSPGPRLPSADGQLSGLASDLRMVYVWYIHGICLVYPWYILSDSKSCLLSAIK